MLLMMAGTFFSAISQILLKQSSNIERKNRLFDYLNPRVIVAYFIFFGVLLLNTYAYTKVPYRFGSIIDTFTYVFVLLLSRFWLKEKISPGKVVGNMIIIVGIVVYSFG